METKNKKLEVLVVEDGPDFPNKEKLESMFEKEGKYINITLKTNLKDGMDEVQSGKYDALVSDVNVGYKSYSGEDFVKYDYTDKIEGFDYEAGWKKIGEGARELFSEMIDKGVISEEEFQKYYNSLSEKRKDFYNKKGLLSLEDDLQETSRWFAKDSILSKDKDDWKSYWGWESDHSGERFSWIEKEATEFSEGCKHANISVPIVFEAKKSSIPYQLVTGVHNPSSIAGYFATGLLNGREVIETLIEGDYLRLGQTFSEEFCDNVKKYVRENPGKAIGVMNTWEGGQGKPTEVWHRAIGNVLKQVEDK